MDLSYPIGKFPWPSSVSPDERHACLDELAVAPERFRQAVEGLTDTQLDTPYRPDGWTVRQVIHHVPDSHMNSYCRCRWALTEDNPPVKGYNEAKWAELYDARTGPVDPSLRLLEAIHARWVSLFGSLSEEDWSRTFDHSENGPMRLDVTLALYAWHCRHHAAHINNLRDRMGWK
jgi:hypothetical protein